MKRDTINKLLATRESAQKQINEINKLLDTLITSFNVRFPDNTCVTITPKTSDAWPKEINYAEKFDNDYLDIFAILFENPHEHSDVYQYMYTNGPPVMATDKKILNMIKFIRDSCSDDFERGRLNDLAKIVYGKSKALHALYYANDNPTDLTLEDLETFETYISASKPTGNLKEMQEVIQAVNVVIFMMKHKQDHTWLFGKLQDLVRQFIHSDNGRDKVLVSIE